jgi:DNA polymerase-4
MERWIIHVDMDEFFAAVEKLDDPSLRGRCILVGGDPDARGVVSTASYEARAFGCRSAMPMVTAVRLCPQAVVLPVRGRRYRQVSEQVFGILARFTPVIEPLSIDEAFLDFSGSARALAGGSAGAEAAERIGRSIRAAVREEVHLTASVGAAANMFLAKLASDLAKPDGLTVIAPGRVHEVLDPLPVRKLWGVGPAAEERLGRRGIRTVGALRRQRVERLREWLGAAGEHLHRLANGVDDRAVTPDSQAKSIGQEITFAEDVGELGALRGVLLEQVEQVGRRLRRQGLKARCVTLKLRYGDFTTLTRSRTLAAATDITGELWSAAEGLLAAWARKSFRPLRLLGVTASALAGRAGEQLALFADPARDRQRRLDAALDDIAARFGPGALYRGPRPRQR